MTASEVMKQLEKLGSAQTRKTFARHGCPENFFGVKVGDMKPIVKQIKTDTALARQLYKTGNGDAQYFAGLIANGAELSVKELDDWAKSASWQMISEWTVAWVAAEHPEGWETALGWIDSGEDHIASAGWKTLASIVGFRPDAELDRKAIEKLLKRAGRDIRKSPNRTRYAMNAFVIAVGAGVAGMTEAALAAAKAMGKVSVDVGDTACKVPEAAVTIPVLIKRDGPGRKRKNLKC